MGEKVDSSESSGTDFRENPADGCFNPERVGGRLAQIPDTPKMLRSQMYGKSPKIEAQSVKNIAFFFVPFEHFLYY